jgi:hypothetical protein
MTAFTTVTASVGSPITDLAAQLLAVANGDTCEVGTQNLFFVVSNGGAVPTTATITTPGSVEGLAIADAELTVAAGDIALMPLPMLFRGSDNRATVNYTATATVTAGVVKLGY